MLRDPSVLCGKAADATATNLVFSYLGEMFLPLLSLLMVFNADYNVLPLSLATGKFSLYLKLLTVLLI